MKKIKKILQFGLLAALFLVSHSALAAQVRLVIRDGNTIIFNEDVPVPTEIETLTDSDGESHDVNPSSVLAVVASADVLSEDFEISDLDYFSSFDSLYVKCISYSQGESCDNWLYAVNNSDPDVGMDKKIISGGRVYVYFGPQNRVNLGESEISTTESLTVTAQKYDYENNAWLSRDGVTVGIFKPDPNDPFGTPTEIKTSPVDDNGQAVFSGIPEGSYSVGVKEDFYFPSETLTVSPSLPTTSQGSRGRGTRSQKEENGEVLGATTQTAFDLEKAFDFLAGEQKDNGSFEEDLYTDWVALALAPANYQTEVIKLIRYLQESKIESSRVTDYERRAMALLSLGLNPYNTNGVNYIGKILASFDGKQFGDPHENNDDVFALIVLENVGFTPDEKMMQDTVAFVLSAQSENGSWNESVDMTGATIVSLTPFSLDTNVKNALAQAEKYLKGKQKDNGGWSDSASSTAWAIEGILALNQKPEEWKKDGKSPIDYLVTLQGTDGGIKNEIVKNKIWETAYVLSALSGKNWSQIMQKFSKREEASTLALQPAPVQKVAVKPVTKKIVVAKKALPAPEAATQNTAATINSITPPSPTEPTKPEVEQKGWFKRLLEAIF